MSRHMGSDKITTSQIKRRNDPYAARSEII